MLKFLWLLLLLSCSVDGPTTGGGTDNPNFVKGTIKSSEIAQSNKLTAYLYEHTEEQTTLIDSSTIIEDSYDFSISKSGEYIVEATDGKVKSKPQYFSVIDVENIELPPLTLSKTGALKTVLFIEPGSVEDHRKLEVRLQKTPYRSMVQGNGFTQFSSISQGVYTVEIIDTSSDEGEVLCTGSFYLKPEKINRIECRITKSTAVFE